MRAVWTTLGTDARGVKYVGRIMNNHERSMNAGVVGEIWRCAHVHRRREAAQRCADKELARRKEQSND